MSVGYWETLVEGQVDGPTLTAAARASCIPPAAKFTLRPNFFDRIGKKLFIRAQGRISSLITTPGTARYDIVFGAALMFDSLAILLDTVAGHTTVPWWLEIEMTCRAIGATGNLFTQGRWSCEDILGVPATAPKGVLTAMLPWNVAPAVGANFDTTASQTIDMFFTQTVATGQMILHQYTVISPN